MDVRIDEAGQEGLPRPVDDLRVGGIAAPVGPPETIRPSRTITSAGKTIRSPSKRRTPRMTRAFPLGDTFEAGADCAVDNENTPAARTAAASPKTKGRRAPISGLSDP